MDRLWSASLANLDPHGRCLISRRCVCRLSMMSLPRRCLRLVRELTRLKGCHTLLRSASRLGGL